jgi:hypothetical protein
LKYVSKNILAEAVASTVRIDGAITGGFLSCSCTSSEILTLGKCVSLPLLKPRVGYLKVGEPLWIPSDVGFVDWLMGEEPFVLGPVDGEESS